MAEQKSKFAEVANDKTQVKIQNINMIKAPNKLATPIKAIMAGFIITVIYVMITKAKLIFPEIPVGDKKINLNSLITGLLFPFALFIIIKKDLELATSNMAYSSFSLARGEVRKREFWALIIGTLGYNFLGSLIAAVLLKYSGVITPEYALSMDHVTEAKLKLNFSQQFISGIFANFCIGIAVVVYLESKEEFGKVLGLFVGVFIFAFMGFEHVVANGAIFIANIVFNPEMISHLPQMTSNIIAAFFGNLVGGGLFIGVVQALIYRA